MIYVRFSCFMWWIMKINTWCILVIIHHVGHVFDVPHLATQGIRCVLLVFSYSVLAYISGIIDFIIFSLCNPIFCLTSPPSILYYTILYYTTLHTYTYICGTQIQKVVRIKTWCRINNKIYSQSDKYHLKYNTRGTETNVYRQNPINIQLS